jgi:hypothetical protein
MKLNHHLFQLAIFLFIGISSSAQKLVPCSEVNPTDKSRKYGYCDSLRIDVIIKCQYDSAYTFNDGLARIIKEGKTGYIDAMGKPVIPAVYLEGEDFSNGFALVKKESDYLYINKTGINQFKKNFPIPVRSIEGASEAVKKLLLDAAVKTKKNCRFYEGLAMFFDTVAKKAGFIDTKGVVALPANYVYATKFSEGIAFVKESPTTKIKAIDKKGKTLFELDDNTKPISEEFKNEFAVVMVNNTTTKNIGYNYIDKSGKLLLAEPVSNAEPFTKNKAVITTKEGDKVLINNKGEIIFNQYLKYLKATDVTGIYFYSNDTERGFGLMDSTGKRRTKPGYIKFVKLNDSVFLCQPWGTSLYTLLSIHSGELIYTATFTAYYWTKVNGMPVIRLEGVDLFDKYQSLDYQPASGKFLKDGKELAAKDNYSLKPKTDAEKKKEEEALKPGTIKYENNWFSLRFPKEMETYEITDEKSVYHSSTYYFSILKRKFQGSGEDYINAMLNKLQNSGEYETVNKEILMVDGQRMPQIIATQKKVAGKTQTRFFYAALDNQKTGAGEGVLFVLMGNYFVIDESIHALQARLALQSIKFK